MTIIIGFILWIAFATLVISFFMGNARLEELSRRSERAQRLRQPVTDATPETVDTTPFDY